MFKIIRKIVSICFVVLITASTFGESADWVACSTSANVCDEIYQFHITGPAELQFIAFCRIDSPDYAECMEHALARAK